MKSSLHRLISLKFLRNVFSCFNIILREQYCVAKSNLKEKGTLGGSLGHIPAKWKTIYLNDFITLCFMRPRRSFFQKHAKNIATFTSHFCSSFYISSPVFLEKCVKNNYAMFHSLDWPRYKKIIAKPSRCFSPYGYRHSDNQICSWRIRLD